MADRFYQQAFELVCKEAKTPQTWYVCLLLEVPYYGGPEEGGWWGSDVEVVAYQEFSTEETAQAACEQVRKLATDMEEQARAEYGRHCLTQLDWLQARGLEADWLPEPDGPTRYHVTVCEELPRPSYGPRHYE